MPSELLYHRNSSSELVCPRISFQETCVSKSKAETGVSQASLTNNVHSSTVRRITFRLSNTHTLPLQLALGRAISNRAPLRGPAHGSLENMLNDQAGILRGLRGQFIELDGGLLVPLRPLLCGQLLREYRLFAKRPHRGPECRFQSVCLFREECLGVVGVSDVAAKLEQFRLFQLPECSTALRAGEHGHLPAALVSRLRLHCLLDHLRRSLDGIAWLGGHGIGSCFDIL